MPRLGEGDSSSCLVVSCLKPVFMDYLLPMFKFFFPAYKHCARCEMCF